MLLSSLDMPRMEREATPKLISTIFYPKLDENLKTPRTLLKDLPKSLRISEMKYILVYQGISGLSVLVNK